MSQKGINISILGRNFTVACQDEERSDLLESAQHLDNCMKKIQQTGKVIGTERCAIMAALNIANELLTLQKSTVAQQEATTQLHSLHKKVSSALAQLAD